tara:strand:- start:553 stop:786 length:234 start_codon:yes stop_codon:yes gene_type:complete
MQLSGVDIFREICSSSLHFKGVGGTVIYCLEKIQVESNELEDDASMPIFLTDEYLSLSYFSTLLPKENDTDEKIDIT